ncbi:MAG: hypothetical protein FJ123_00380 [Deltaproteobacteria bacterium]|nr:hypothetical protein [Deltaproteobacteria bacterium]
MIDDRVFLKWTCGSNELVPLSKYKDILIPCFIFGCLEPDIREEENCKRLSNTTVSFLRFNPATRSYRSWREILFLYLRLILGGMVVIEIPYWGRMKSKCH